ncbi:MAG: CHAT domain-containing protein [Blastocatellia bacterium]|nr:CHAT domain-containing protein [Blastocatellia bacterium]
MVTKKNIRYVENLAQENEITQLLEGLHFQFETMRYGDERLGNFAAELKKRTNIYLQKLYQKLILPLEKFIKHRHPVIIPFGKLHYLPFHALIDGEHYLIEKKEVSYAASATVLQYCLEKPKRALENALLIGYADEKIPFVKEEIDKLKEIFPKHKSLFGKDATFANFKKYAESFDLIHLACHGQFRQDNPMFSALRLADGFLTVRDISELKSKCRFNYA